MASVKYRQALTGGGSTSLDKTVSSGLSDGDLAFVAHTDGKIYAYKYDSSSSASESSPDVIQPDDSPATGRWILQTSPFDVSAGVETGDVIIRTNSTVPSGFLECNGAAISRTTYSNLFAEIGETFGAGDGVNTFNIPDFRGEFLRGWDHGSGNDPDAASRTGGDTIGSSQGSAFEAHTHSVTVRDGSTGSAYLQAGTSHKLGSLSTNTGSNGGNETRPRNVAVMYCIKY